MCFSLRAEQNPRTLAEMFDEYAATVEMPGYLDLFEMRLRSNRITIPPAMELCFLDPQSPDEGEAKKLIEAYYKQTRQDLETKLLNYRRDIATLERKLAAKETKTNRQSLEAKQRQLARYKDKLTTLKPGNTENRIFPRHYTSALVNRDGKIVVTPVRYGVFRQTGALIKDILDDDAPDYGLYNCRRDSLNPGRFEQVQHALSVQVKKASHAAHRQWEDVWKKPTDDKRVLAKREKLQQFLTDFGLQESALQPSAPVTQSLWLPMINQHALLVAEQFFENVWRHDFEQRPLKPDEKPVSMQISFTPDSRQNMLIPCLMYEVSLGNTSIPGVAVVTDEPNLEVAARGHDRTPVALDPKAAARFITSPNMTLSELQSLLDHKQRFYFQAEAA